MLRWSRLMSSLVVFSLLTAALTPAARIAHAATSLRADAVVLVNSASAGYLDFQHYIQPYLNHFGVPYTTLDISAASVTSAIGDYALIIIGHRQLDTAGIYLDNVEQAAITSAVNSGSGLVNFDGDLADGSNAGRYSFIQDIFHFSYSAAEPGQIVSYYLTEPGPAMHYIVTNHSGWQEVPLKQSINVTRVNVPLAAHVTELMSVDADPLAPPIALPLLLIADYGQGRAVQWLSYDWMKHAVKGPMYTFDDEVWRGLVWAARKPFVMQALPPLVTMRVDDVDAPTMWVPAANDYGFKPWLGVFLNGINAAEANLLRPLISAGQTTLAIHATSSSEHFYFDHANETNLSDAAVAANFAAGTAFHTNYNLPISKFVVGHNYELGSNVFEELDAWGVEFVAMPMNPGLPEDSDWVMNGPYRLYETGRSFDDDPFTYADYLAVPGHPELNGQFFNCFTEIRDNAGYEWYPVINDVELSVKRGTEQLERALENLALATLFTHEYEFDAVSEANWRAMLQGISQNIDGYAPRYVTMDYACQYVRAQYTSSISASTYDPILRQLTTTLVGSTDLATDFYVFTEEGETIDHEFVSVPVFSGSIDVVANDIGPTLDHVIVTPDPADVNTNATQPFTALGYDAASNLIRGLRFTWSVAHGGGAIDQTGLFTAGGTPGTYADTVVATHGAVQGTATVNVTTPTNFRRLWNDTTAPQNTTVYDGRPIEVGVKFRSDSNGYIHGVRFYKGPQHTGPHVGSLWTINGDLLAQATFTNETATGWQVVTFTAPVAIVANTYYIASYYSPSGYFADTPNYFTSQSHSQAPLHAPAQGVVGPNGVYRYDSPGFPDLGAGYNYWVDVTFATGSGPTAVTVSSLAARATAALPIGALAVAALAAAAVVALTRRR